MAVDKVVEGKQYRYTGKGEGGIAWFEHNSIITVTKDDGSKQPAARGPAACDYVGGNRIKKGEMTEGYARLCSLEELEVETPKADPAAVHVNLNGNSTTIVVQRNLTADEVAAVLKAINAA